MNIRRVILYILLGIILFSIWDAWQIDYGKKLAPPKTGRAPEQIIPTIVKPTITVSQTKVDIKRIVHVRTDVLGVDIDTLGGNVISAKLLKYPLSLKQRDIPIEILSHEPDRLYVAESGLIGVGDHKPLQYGTTRQNYSLSAPQNTLSVKLSWRDKRGFSVAKTFEFIKGSYAIDVNYQIANNTGKNWSGQFYSQIKRRKPDEKGGFFRLRTYTGAAISSPEKPYEKIYYNKLDAEDLSRDIKGGWVAMQQRYFLSAWVPDQTKTHHYYSHVTDKEVYTIGMTNAISAAAGQQTKFGAKLYVGPEVEENLAPLAKGLDLTIDYGWLWIISVAVFWLMKHIYNFVGNWGWSIVIVTILIKLAFYKFSETSYKSMAMMRALAPKMKEIRERYADDKAKMSQATMELYKKEKINPLGGCLPQLIQIPFLIAFYYVLIEAVQLRHAPFVFWIHDLSAKDPYFILPILMGICMFLTQKLTPVSPDPTQARIMMFLPVVFTVLFASFPAGLVLYWLVNYLVSGLQQWYIMRKYEREKSKG
jgi:YidC/Oxa1 family membrane protein insertase